MKLLHTMWPPSHERFLVIKAVPPILDNYFCSPKLIGDWGRAHWENYRRIKKGETFTYI